MQDTEVNKTYLTLKDWFGFLDWWPGETKDEIIIGAILTQNTNWKNVEKAIANLRKEQTLDLKKISSIKTGKLERLIRPSGFYRQKASRLKGFASYIFDNYKGLDQFFEKDLASLREELLSLKGIGPETADSIILYAAEKPIFVIDAYTIRIMSRIHGKKKEFEYGDLQSLISKGIREDLALYKDFHAQFVELGKNYCKKEPLCEECPLSRICKYNKIR